MAEIVKVDFSDQNGRKKTEQRSKLGEKLSAVILDFNHHLTERERLLADEILVQLLGDIEIELRKKLSASLAMRDDAPPTLLRALARDEIIVAQPILENSDLLQDEDLISIVKSCSKEHRIAIAARKRLGDTVSDALVEGGEEDVILALLNNSNASISEATYDYLTTACEKTELFREPLVMRGDLPPQFAYRLFWLVADELQRHILRNFEVSQEMLDHAFAQIRPDEVVEVHDAATQKALRVVLEMRKTNQLSLNRIVDFLSSAETPLFIAGLAVKADISIETVRHIVLDWGREPLAVLAKAIGMDRSQFARVALMVAQANEAKARDLAYLSETLKLFDDMTDGHAERVLHYWDYTGSCAAS